MISAIAHPTDFSSEGAAAFDHALALALHHRARLDLVHVGGRRGRTKWQRFPQVRKRLEAWGRIPPGTGTGEVAGLTGVVVRKIELHDKDPGEALAEFLSDHRPELVVMASHARSGLERLLTGSISTRVAQEAQVPALLFGPGVGGFVGESDGKLALGRVLVPIDHQPPAAPALELLEGIIEGLGATLDCMHVGTREPALRDPHGAPVEVRLQGGTALDTILAEAHGTSLVAMPSEGRHGVADALLGSTAERVLAGARVPVLVLPVGG